MTAWHELLACSRAGAGECGRARCRERGSVMRRANGDDPACLVRAVVFLRPEAGDDTAGRITDQVDRRCSLAQRIGHVLVDDRCLLVKISSSGCWQSYDAHLPSRRPDLEI